MFEDYFKEFNFKPLNDYVEKLEKEIVDIKNNNFNDVNFDNGKFNIHDFKLKSNLDLEIEVIELFGNTTIQFTFLNEGKIVETLCFLLNSFKSSSSGANRSIYHEYYAQDGDNLTVYGSSFNYEDNDYILGYESVRKLSYQEFHKKLSDIVLNNMLNPVNEIDVNNIPTILKHDEDILEEPTINNFSIEGISYASNYLKRLNESFSENEEIQASKEHYKSLKKIKQERI